MFCIPITHWMESEETTTRFVDFKLEAEPEVMSSIKEKLSGLPIEAHSDNQLVLSLREEVREVREEYELRIEGHRVEIISPSLTGIQHGLSTLKLLLFTGKQMLRHGTIADAPKFEHRGVFLDVSRGKMPTIAYLKSLVSFISDLKYNILQLYFEDKYLLATDPGIGLLTGAYSEGQMRELDAWCRANHVELQPCIQAYSHLKGLLNLPEYSGLSENENLFSFAAGNVKVYEFLDRVFAQVLPWFSSTTVNINMDEAYDLGTGCTKAAVEGKGKGEVYLEHIRTVSGIAQRYGAKKVIIWGDIALRYKELLTKLPENIIVADWNYNPLEKFASLETLQESGIDFWAAGGVSTWNSLFPRVYNSYTNLINYSRESRLKGAKGFLVTDWGDYGHFQPLGLSLYGYMIGAQHSYHACSTLPSAIEGNT
ncbi:MAG TPA: family 20 glycosylhydrolase, partial [Clostridiaceae bacterium]|nr:family 20 glycosylhydrolase [Clostridiaceae bacterium]